MLYRYEVSIALVPQLHVLEDRVHGLIADLRFVM